MPVYNAGGIMKKINEIKEYEYVKDYYYITTCGKVISTKGGKMKILKGNLIKKGYKQVGLSVKGGGNKSIKVHRLVALAYIPNPENKPQVNHIDEVKTHNYVGNLEWMTARENNNHGTRNERSGMVMRGSNHYNYGKPVPRSKPMEYYETKGTKRGHFKTICKRQGWDFDDFIEIDSDERYYAKDGVARDRKYYYFYKYK